jgi:hypothetical protein
MKIPGLLRRTIFGSLALRSGLEIHQEVMTLNTKEDEHD